MNRWKKTLLKEKSTIQKAMVKLQTSGLSICLVVDKHQKLIGTVTDGDIRRGLLKKISLNSPVEKIMNKKPRVAFEHDSINTLLTLFEKFDLKQVPIVDMNMKVVGLKQVKDLITNKHMDVPVVIMAGGLGERLGELTKETPKPMLKVGGKPILEIIIEKFKTQGFTTFYIAVNYKSEMIIDYFRDGLKFGVNIKYIYEKKRLGTAGALSLIKEKFDVPVIVMNGDLLTNVNFEMALNFHNKQRSMGTMCIREYDFQVPFGIVSTNKNSIKKIDEKPTQTFYVNAGIYIISGEAIKYIPKNTFFDMPQLFNKLIGASKRTSAFKISDYWLDVGNFNDFVKAQTEVKHVLN